MTDAFTQVENLRQTLLKHAQQHQWSACLSLTEELGEVLRHLPEPKDDTERQILTDIFASFLEMHESALAEHKDIQKLLQAFDENLHT